MDLQDATHATVINCGSQLQLSTIEKQRDVLLAAITIGKPITLKAQDIKVIDVASLQLFIAFTQACDLAKIQWSLEQPTSIFIKVVELLGAKELLKIK